MCWLSDKVNSKPKFNEYTVPANELMGKIQGLGLSVQFGGMLDSYYYYTDLEGWGEILWDLVFRSGLYSQDKYDCENYALKAMNECAEKYGLNTMMAVVGQMPQGRHGFNLFYYGRGLLSNASGFMLFEPNDGFAWSGAFEIGEFGYKPEQVLV